MALHVPRQSQILVIFVPLQMAEATLPRVSSSYKLQLLFLLPSIFHVLSVDQNVRRIYPMGNGLFAAEPDGPSASATCLGPAAPS